MVGTHSNPITNIIPVSINNSAKDSCIDNLGINLLTNITNENIVNINPILF